MDWYIAHLIWARGGAIVSFLCFWWAAWKGGPTERHATLLYAVSFGLSPILTQFDEPGPGIYVKILDCFVFAAFVALAIRSRRLWVFISCMCMLNGIVTYFALSWETIGMYAYVTATGFWFGHALVICLAAGVIDYQRTLKRQAISPAQATSTAQG